MVLSPKPNPTDADGRTGAGGGADLRSSRTVADRALGALLEWYEPRRRAYPWRLPRPDPYAVLVSEVMLQQTQAARVVSHFRRFLLRFPTVQALAAAPRAAVVRAWAGLGYNRRAVALSEAARAIVRDHAGRVPSDPSVLRTLPGVGPYTAAAVAAFAYGRPVTAVDTNVARVVARARLGADVASVSRVRVEAAAEAWLTVQTRNGGGGGGESGDANQALMDLGRNVCRPRPRCPECPLRPSCGFARAGARAVSHGIGTGQRFEGSSRQLRGRVVAVLRDRPAASLAAIAAEAGRPLDEVAVAVRGLRRDGLVDAGPAALAGRASGRVRLRD